MAGAARHGCRRRWPARAEGRQHAAAQVVAVELFIGVAVVLDPLKAPRAQPLTQLRPGDLEQRPHQQAARERGTGGHGGEPGNTGTAQQLQQHGLKLVVLVVGGEQHLVRPQGLRQRRVACQARRRLGRGTARTRYEDAAHFEGHTERSGAAPAMRTPARGVRPQLVVDVHRPHLQAPAPQPRERRQERGRVRAATEGDTGGHPREPGDERAQPGGQP